jgi:DNA-binding NarL/FixJ family response regulator
LTTKCLLVCKNDFMAAGVKALLAEQTDLELTMIGAFSEKELAQVIEKLQPDTVILDEEVCEVLPADSWRLLREVNDLQVIIFNQKNNVLRMYQNEWSGKARVQDLGTVIRSRGSHSQFS